MNSSNETVLVAADGGGTGCRACAGTLERGILARTCGGPGNIQSDFDGAIANLTGAISDALQLAGLDTIPNSRITAHLGVAGAHSMVEVEAVTKVLPYGRFRVTGDRPTSVRGVLGDVDGYVVALGTGTIIARQTGSQIDTVGGWGFDLSDHASGAWLGHRLLEEALLAHEGLRPHTPLSRSALQANGGLVPTIHFSAKASPGDYAALAKDVVEAACESDVLALELMAQGAAFIERALATLGFAKGDVLSLAGGVGPHYARYLPDYITANLHSPKGSALEGAFAMAAQIARASEERSSTAQGRAGPI